MKEKLKSVNIWQSYKQERDCLVHFLRLIAVCWPGAVADLRTATSAVADDAPAQRLEPRIHVRSTKSCYKPNYKQNALSISKVTFQNPKLSDPSMTAIHNSGGPFHQWPTRLSPLNPPLARHGASLASQQVTAV